MNANMTLQFKNVTGMASYGNEFFLEIANSEPVKLFTKSADSIQVEDSSIAQYLCGSFEGKDVETPDSAIKQIIQSNMVKAFEAEKERIKDILLKLQSKPHSSMVNESLNKIDSLRVAVIESTLNGSLFKNSGSSYIQEMVQEYRMLNQLMIEFTAFDTLITKLTAKLGKIFAELEEDTKERKNLIKNLNLYATETSFKVCRSWVMGKTTDQIENTFLKDAPDAKRRLCMKELSLEDLVKNIGICLN